MNREEAREYIEDRVEPCPETGCWLWTLFIVPPTKHSMGGYGRCNPAMGGGQHAHRLSYMAYNGDIPQGLLVRHKCHTPACCNPDHLEVGTHANNRKDAIVARRVPTRLTEQQVREIHERRSAGETCQRLANEFGVAHTTVVNICTGKKWAHLGLPPIRTGPARGRRAGRKRLTEALAREIIARKRAGERPCDFWRDYPAGRATVEQCANGRTWKYLHEEAA